MHNQDEFLAMIPGAMGWVYYKIKDKPTAMTNQEEQDFIDNYTREAMSVLLTKATYSYENIMDPLTAHFTARQDARKILDKMGPSIVVKKTDLQIGSADSLTFLRKLEQRQDFAGWVNPGIIKLFVDVTNDHLRKQK